MKIFSGLFIFCLLGRWSNMVNSLDAYLVFNENKVAGELGASLQLDCGYQPPSTSIQNCAWKNPMGKILQVGDNLDVRFSLPTKKFWSQNQCGIIINALKREDIGKWTCIINFNVGSRQASKEVTLDKQGGCPENEHRTQLIDGKCFRASFERKTWQEARDYCISIKSTLAYPTTKPEVDVLLGFLRDRRQSHEYWVDASTLHNHYYRWSNNGPPVTAGWHRGRPWTNETGMCVSILYAYLKPGVDDGFREYKCTDKHEFVCEENINYDCPESLGYYRPRYSKQCFKLYTDVYRHWEDAKDWCESHGLVLAKPEDNIAHQLRQYARGKICGPGKSCEEGVWLGAKCSGASCIFIWEKSRSTLSDNHQFWSKDGFHKRNGYCLEMVSVGASLYYSKECSEPKPFICEKVILS